MNKKTALITGASAGIGRDLARIFAREGFDLVLVARREDRLRELSNELEQSYQTKTLVITADLINPDACKNIYQQTRQNNIHVDVLINNAGFSVPKKFIEVPFSRQMEFMQVMVNAVIELTHLYLPHMVEQNFGRIMNVASIAGLLPGAPGGTLYAASKAFLIKFSESLAAELYGKDVRVLALCPGLTYSEFHDVAQTRANVSRMPKIMWMDGPEVAEQGYKALMRGDVVFINGIVNHGLTRLSQILPPSIARRVMANQRRNLDDL